VPFYDIQIAYCNKLVYYLQGRNLFGPQSGQCLGLRSALRATSVNAVPGLELQPRVLRFLLSTASATRTWC
jgi:hypothetical protein